MIKNYTEFSMYGLKSMKDSFNCSSIEELKKLYSDTKRFSYEEIMASELINDNLVSQRFVDTVSASTELLFDIYDGNATHIFMPELSFCDWAISCCPRDKSDVMMQINQNLVEDLGSKLYVIHFPTGQGLESFSFKICDGQNEGEKEIMIRTKTAFEIYPNRIDIENESRRTKPELMERVNWYGELVVGLSMYIGCFPKQFVNGLPECLQAKPRFKKVRAITVGVSKELGIGASKSPHYRCGHTRLLSSAKFVHKQGEIIFIKPCFIKGRAKTVKE